MVRILVNAASMRPLVGGAARHLQAFWGALRRTHPDDKFFLASRVWDGYSGYIRWTLRGVNDAARTLECDAILGLLNVGPIRPIVPHVLLERNPTYFHPAFRDRPSLRRMAVRQMMRGASRIIVPSTTQANWLLDTFPEFESTNKIRVVPHGVDRAIFFPGPRHNGSQLTVLFVGLRAKWKGHETLEEACRDLPVTLLMADNVPQDEVPALYRAADIFGYPSWGESFGLAALEAMASGLPIVAADTEVNREILGDAALYFPPHDWATLRAQLKRLIADTLLRATLGDRGYARSQRFSWEQCATDVMAILREVAS